MVSIANKLPNRNRPQTLTGIETYDGVEPLVKIEIGIDLKPLQGLKRRKYRYQSPLLIIGIDLKPLQGLKPPNPSPNPGPTHRNRPQTLTGIETTSLLNCWRI